MNPILRLAPRRAIQPISTSFPSSTFRTFTAASRLRLKEDHPNTPERAQEIEKAKQEQMQKGEWKEELASAGEAHIKADKHDVENHDAHMEDLQKQTAQKHQDEHPDGK